MSRRCGRRHGRGRSRLAQRGDAHDPARRLADLRADFFGLGCRRAARARAARHAPNSTGSWSILALPALLFDMMAHAGWATFWQPGFIAAFGLSCARRVRADRVAADRRGARPLADASIDGLNAAYANTGFIGLPLCLVVFGRDSLALATIATILTVCVLFAGRHRADRDRACRSRPAGIRLAGGGAVAGEQPAAGGAGPGRRNGGQRA